jgi:hypothetical protein
MEGKVMTSSGNLASVAIHEASHLVVYVKVGGKPSKIGQVLITENGGYVRSDPVYNRTYGALPEAAITAAGIACDQIRGITPYLGPRSDTRRLSDILMTNEVEEKLVVDKTQVWLQKNWHLVQRTADQFVGSTNKRGIVPRRVVKEIVNELMLQLPKPKRHRRQADDAN